MCERLVHLQHLCLETCFPSGHRLMFVFYQALDRLGSTAAPLLPALMADVPPLPFDACRFASAILPYCPNLGSLMSQERVFTLLISDKVSYDAFINKCYLTYGTIGSCSC